MISVGCFDDYGWLVTGYIILHCLHWFPGIQRIVIEIIFCCFFFVHSKWCRLYRHLDPFLWIHCERFFARYPNLKHWTNDGKFFLCLSYAIFQSRGSTLLVYFHSRFFFIIFFNIFHLLTFVKYVACVCV